MNSIIIRGKKINHEPTQNAFWRTVELRKWEEHTFDVLDKYIKPGKKFIDIGAWNGVLSLYANSLGAVCYAVEPDDTAHKYLSENVELNTGTIHITRAAISDQNGTMALKSANGDWGNSMSSLLDQDGTPKDSYVVGTMTLERYINETLIKMQDVSLIKIDIEGAEAMVIPYSKKFLQHHKPIIYLALHSFWFPDFYQNIKDISETIFPIYHVLLNGTKEITSTEFIAEMNKRDCCDVLLLPRTQTVSLVVLAYNRPDYLERCFDSLKNLTIQPTHTIVVDDASTDIRTKQLIADSGFTPIFHSHNQGVKTAIINGAKYAFNNLQSDLVIILDGDAIVKPNFIETLTKVHNEHDCIVSGFNHISYRNPILREGKGVVYKKLCNGINMCFNLIQWEKYIKSGIVERGNWDFNTSLHHCKDDKMFAITTPSVVQHIGKISTMGHEDMDIAEDFRPLMLKNVTLFGIDARNPQGIKRAAEICQQNIDFGDTVIITESLFTGATLQEGRENYSKFMIKELDKYINTAFVLTIHADGYVVNWNAWDYDWLLYDYIGATWNYKDNKNVGNGGFSLRSKKLIRILATDKDIEAIHPEDDTICRYYREYLEQGYGIKFAPEHIANKFSIEAYGSNMFDSQGKKGNLYNGQFGFHGPHVDFSNHAEYNINPENIYKRP